MFHLIFVHYTLSSVWVGEWPLFGKIAACSVGHMFPLSFVCLYFFIYFPLWFKERDLALIAPVPVHCFSIIFILLTFHFQDNMLTTGLDIISIAFNLSIQTDTAIQLTLKYRTRMMTTMTATPNTEKTTANTMTKALSSDDCTYTEKKRAFKTVPLSHITCNSPQPKITNKFFGRHYDFVSFRNFQAQAIS